jgi:hypothetical protein
MKLIFVYNANGGIFNSLKDAVHKSVNPKTYPCSLCQITFGAVSMKGEWKEFIDSLKIKTVFLHKDEFEKLYGEKKYSFPAVFVDRYEKLELLIYPEEIDACTNVKELKQVVKTSLEAIDL